METTAVSRREREQRLGHKAITLWLTGLSGSGKSSISQELERRLFAAGQMVYRLDGDNLRFGLNRDLGFSHDDRSENIRRAAEAARLLNEAGVLVICSFISPFKADRQRAREIIGNADFTEIYLSTSLEVCESRDPKGLYKKVRAGEIQEFTGISSPYEAPEHPEISIDTSVLNLDESVNRIIASLSGLHTRPD